MIAVAQQPSRYWHAALLMLGSACFFGLMAVAIRLASATLHTFEIAFFRNFFGLVAAAPLLLRHGPQILRTDQFPRYIVRCLIGVVSMFCGFWAIGHLPLALPGRTMMSTPMKPTSTAAQRRARTCSPSIHTAAMVTNSGVEYDSETACASGRWPIAQKPQNIDTTPITHRTM